MRVTIERLQILRDYFGTLQHEPWLTERNKLNAVDLEAALTELIGLRKGVPIEGEIS